MARVPELSLASGPYTKPPRRQGDDPWYLTAVDFHAGRTVYKRLAGEGSVAGGDDVVCGGSDDDDCAGSRATIASRTVWGVTAATAAQARRAERLRALSAPLER